MTKENTELAVKEFHNQPRDVFWYLGIVILLAALLLVGWQSRNYLFMAAIIAFGLALARLANLTAPKKRLKINEGGLEYEKRPYIWSDFKNFSAKVHASHTDIHLERLNLALPLNFAVEVPTEARLLLANLAKHLPEKERGFSLADTLHQLLRI